jgi:hypothetical protein
LFGHPFSANADQESVAKCGDVLIDRILPFLTQQTFSNLVSSLLERGSAWLVLLILSSAFVIAHAELGGKA